jgi:hypothetical protein
MIGRFSILETRHGHVCLDIADTRVRGRDYDRRSVLICRDLLDRGVYRHVNMSGKSLQFQNVEKEVSTFLKCREYIDSFKMLRVSALVEADFDG